MKKEQFEAVFKSAIDNYARFVAVGISTEGNTEPEIIINPYNNFEEKFKYYKEAYDDDMRLIATIGKKDIRIIAVAQADKFEDLEWQLTEKKPDWKKMISGAIEKTVKKMIENHPDVTKEQQVNFEMILESIKQQFCERRYTPSQERFICDNISLYEEMFDVCMNGSSEEFKEKFLDLSKRLGEA